MSRRISLAILLATTTALYGSFGCSSADSDGSEEADPGATGEDALTQRQDDEYFYDGPLDALNAIGDLAERDDLPLLLRRRRLRRRLRRPTPSLATGP